MAEGFKAHTPDEQRALANAVLEDGFTRLAQALQQVGMCALISKAKDRELELLNQGGKQQAQELDRITQGALIELCMEAVDGYIAAAGRALRFDELEGSDG